MSDIMDVELKMHAFRLMRSGQYKTAAAVLEAMKEEFPGVDEDRIRRTLAALAAKMLEAGA